MNFRQALSKAADKVERTAAQHRDAVRERDALLLEGQSLGYTQAELARIARVRPGTVGAAQRKHRKGA